MKPNYNIFRLNDVISLDPGYEVLSFNLDLCTSTLNIDFSFFEKVESYSTQIKDKKEVYEIGPRLIQIDAEFYDPKGRILSISENDIERAKNILTILNKPFLMDDGVVLWSTTDPISVQEIIKGKNVSHKGDYSIWEYSNNTFCIFSPLSHTDKGTRISNYCYFNKIDLKIANLAFELSEGKKENLELCHFWNKYDNYAKLFPAFFLLNKEKVLNKEEMLYEIAKSYYPFLSPVTQWMVRKTECKNYFLMCENPELLFVNSGVLEFLRGLTRFQNNIIDTPRSLKLCLQGKMGEKMKNLVLNGLKFDRNCGEVLTKVKIDYQNIYSYLPFFEEERINEIIENNPEIKNILDIDYFSRRNKLKNVSFQERQALIHRSSFYTPIPKNDFIDFSNIFESFFGVSPEFYSKKGKNRWSIVDDGGALWSPNLDYEERYNINIIVTGKDLIYKELIYLPGLISVLTDIYTPIYRESKILIRSRPGNTPRLISLYFLTEIEQDNFPIWVYTFFAKKNNFETDDFILKTMEGTGKKVLLSKKSLFEVLVDDVNDLQKLLRNKLPVGEPVKTFQKFDEGIVSKVQNSSQMYLDLFPQIDIPKITDATINVAKRILMDETAEKSSYSKGYLEVGNIEVEMKMRKVNKRQYFNVFSKIKEMRDCVNIIDEVIIFPNNIRKIGKKYEQKKREYHSILEYDFSITVSEERNVNPSFFLSKDTLPIKKRSRNRWSVITIEGVKIDLSVVDTFDFLPGNVFGNKQRSYEIEVEINRLDDIYPFLKVITDVYFWVNETSKVFTKKEKESALNKFHNFSLDSVPEKIKHEVKMDISKNKRGVDNFVYSNFIGNLRNLKKEDLTGKGIGKCGVSVKADGEQVYLLFENNNLWMLQGRGSNFITLITSSIEIEQFDGMILVGENIPVQNRTEFKTSKLLFACFDILSTPDSINLSKKNYKDRVEIYTSLIESLNLESVVILAKEVFFDISSPSKLWNKIKNINDKTYPFLTDGFVVTSIDSFTNPDWLQDKRKLPLSQKPAICKIKSFEDTTIDFVIKDRTLFVLDRGDLVDFSEVVTRNEFKNDVNVDWTSVDIFLKKYKAQEDDVIEMGPTLIDETIILSPKRIRVDKNGRPNNAKIADDVWKDLNEVNIFEYLDPNNIRRLRNFNNRVKSKLINTHILDEKMNMVVVVDIGSGRGGDIFKYEMADGVLFVEPDDENFTILQENIKSRTRKEFRQAVHCGAENYEIIVQNLMELISQINDKTTHTGKTFKSVKKVVISCMLTLTFLVNDKSGFKETIKEINKACYTKNIETLELIFYTVEGESFKELIKSGILQDGPIEASLENENVVKLRIKDSETVQSIQEENLVDLNLLKNMLGVDRINLKNPFEILNQTLSKSTMEDNFLTNIEFEYLKTHVTGYVSLKIEKDGTKIKPINMKEGKFSSILQRFYEIYESGFFSFDINVKSHTPSKDIPKKDTTGNQLRIICDRLKVNFDRVTEAKRKLDFFYQSGKTPVGAYNIELPIKELVGELKKSNKAQIVSKAWLKCYEIANFFELEKMVKTSGYFKGFFNAEFPGSFISAMNHYCYTKNKNFLWLASSLIPEDGNTALEDIYCLYKNNPNFWLMSAEKGIYGDLTSLNDSEKLHEELIRNGSKGDTILYTADGGIDLEGNYENEEIANMLLLGGEIDFMVRPNVLKTDGACIIKTFTITEPATVSMVMFLSSLFTNFSICKPIASKPSNSEVYLVGKGYKRNSQQANVNKFREWFSTFVKNPDPKSAFCYSFDKKRVSRFMEFSEIITERQIKALSLHYEYLKLVKEEGILTADPREVKSIWKKVNPVAELIDDRKRLKVC